MPTSKEHLQYTLEEWKKEEFQRIVNAIPDVKVFCDIGANVGGVTVILKEKFPEMEAHCFEPVTVNFEELVKNVPFAHNYKVGIYYGKTESNVLWRGSNDGAYFVEHIDSGEPRIRTGEVMELVELEDFGIKPDLVKLDVEGAEENILEHSSLIKKTPMIIVEWHPNVDPFKFFEKHLPNHEIRVNLHNQQFLLCLR